eukprot:TRINITY_DN14523_c0_g1_i3.p1 TRINITY_DN14523_c0_g1~~TRINITY_DN14523_c0_g1_i3.p1  ORF type:complete len:168 (-),score=28.55 TRINITY_DN14523_c0_g1_i3:205-678(-)
MNSKKRYIPGFKVISGGQTGADRAALEAAREVGIRTGGTAPADYKTEKGPDHSLKDYGLVEGSMGYAARTKKNVDDSTATLVIRLHEGNGTDKTIGYCQSRTWGYGERGCSKFNGYRPVLVLNSLDIQENVFDLLLPDNISRCPKFLISVLKTMSVF